LDLVAEHAVVALGLIELLRGRRLLGEQPARPVVAAPGDLVLRDERAALRTRRVTLGRRRRALRVDDGDLPLHFVDARRGRAPLRARLLALDGQLRGIDLAD